MISVLIPTLTLDRYLDAAVESTLGDDSGGALEVVVVFDGRDPEARPHWVYDHRVRFEVTGARMGAGRAINFAARLARGEFLARLDADDLTRRGRFGAQVDRLRRGDIVAVGAQADVIGETGEVLGEFVVRPYRDVRHALLWNNPFVHSSLMFPRDLFHYVGGYNETCVRMQDYELMLRLACLGKLEILDDRYIGYRVHDGQTSSIMQEFVPLMTTIVRRRQELARTLGVSRLQQLTRDLLFVASQWSRYAKLRRPHYLAGIS